MQQFLILKQIKEEFVSSLWTVPLYLYEAKDKFQKQLVVIYSDKECLRRNLQSNCF